MSEVVRRNDRAGALLASLPFVSFITLFWVYYESAPEQRLQKTGDHMFYIFWYVLPTLPMFLLFRWLQKQWGFYGGAWRGRGAHGWALRRIAVWGGAVRTGAVSLVIAVRLTAAAP